MKRRRRIDESGNDNGEGDEAEDGDEREGRHSRHHRTMPSTSSNGATKRYRSSSSQSPRDNHRGKAAAVPRVNVTEEDSSLTTDEIALGRLLTEEMDEAMEVLKTFKHDLGESECELAVILSTVAKSCCLW